METVESGSTNERLARIETKLDDQISELQLLRIRASANADAIRALQDWRVEMNVYMRQVKWLFLLVFGTFIASVISIAIEVMRSGIR
jgi:hypothetical protein